MRTSETCIFGEDETNDKNKEISTQEEIFFRIVATDIREKIHQIIDGWGYCYCLVEY